MTPRPPFDDLPLHQEDPPFSAWGLYGLHDELGALNLLTPEVVAEAAKEIQSGQRVGLDLAINYLAEPSHGRLKLTHNILPIGGDLGHDDTLEFNTQISSQWDGFRHYGYQRARRYYNNVSEDDITGPHSTSRLGIHNWCKKGIVGRGILLDYYRWAQSQDSKYDLLGDHTITVDDLRACAAAQNLTFKYGDILFVRSGWKVGYDAMTVADQKYWSQHNDPIVFMGVETSVAMARFLWETGFSACAGDAPGWERIPVDVGTENEKALKGVRLHEIMLSGWGMPIGEMFDLDALSEECLRQGRYSFFVASMPLHVPGGVASPPNAVAIF